MKNRCCAFIPVRGGSKGIPRKNIELFCGKPLVYWTIKAAVDCHYIDRVYVATDDVEIRRVVEEFQFQNVEVIDRSAETATDSASSELALLEFLRNYECKTVVFIQATSPLLRSETLDLALGRYKSSDADSMLSVYTSHRFVWKRIDGTEQVISMNYHPEARPRRQDWKGELIENGAFYISSREAVLASGCRLSGRVICFEMSAEDSFEIDNMHDWHYAASLKRKQQNFVLIDALKKQPPNLLICDVDGTLTDAGMYTSEDGNIHKRFNTRDGHGLSLLRSRGVKVMFLTSEHSEAVVARAKKLGIEYVATGILNKAEYLQQFYEYNDEHSWSKTAYIGDDVNDLLPLRKVRFSACPNDAHPNVKEVVQFVCERPGGGACVRELCDLILKCFDENYEK